MEPMTQQLQHPPHLSLRFFFEDSENLLGIFLEDSVQIHERFQDILVRLRLLQPLTRWILDSFAPTIRPEGEGSQSFTDGLGGHTQRGQIEPHVRSRICVHECKEGANAAASLSLEELSSAIPRGNVRRKPQVRWSVFGTPRCLIPAGMLQADPTQRWSSTTKTRRKGCSCMKTTLRCNADATAVNDLHELLETKNTMQLVAQTGDGEQDHETVVLHRVVR